MDISEPTPSQAAYILRRHLQSEGVHISLSVAQESIARVRGYKDWNILASHVHPRGNRKASSSSGKQILEQERLLVYPTELSQLPVSRWVECFEECWPKETFRNETPEERERLRLQWDTLDTDERYAREERLRADFYLAIEAAGLTEPYRYIVGEPGQGKAELGYWLQLVFGKRIANRFLLKVCPTLNWDALEVWFVTYELDNILGDRIVDEIWHPSIAARPEEMLSQFIPRAMAASTEIEADIQGWLSANTSVTKFEVGKS